MKITSYKTIIFLVLFSLLSFKTYSQQYDTLDLKTFFNKSYAINGSDFVEINWIEHLIKGMRADEISYYHPEKKGYEHLSYKQFFFRLAIPDYHHIVKEDEGDNKKGDTLYFLYNSGDLSKVILTKYEESLESIILCVPADHPDNTIGELITVAKLKLVDVKNYLKDGQFMWYNLYNHADSLPIVEAFEQNLYDTELLEEDTVYEKFTGSRIYKELQNRAQARTFYSKSHFSVNYNLFDHPILGFSKELHEIIFELIKKERLDAYYYKKSSSLFGSDKGWVKFTGDSILQNRLNYLIEYNKGKKSSLEYYNRPIPDFDLLTLKEINYICIDGELITHDNSHEFVPQWVSIYLPGYSKYNAVTSTLEFIKVPYEQFSQALSKEDLVWTHPLNYNFKIKGDEVFKQQVLLIQQANQEDFVTDFTITCYLDSLGSYLDFDGTFLIKNYKMNSNFLENWNTYDRIYHSWNLNKIIVPYLSNYHRSCVPDEIKIRYIVQKIFQSDKLTGVKLKLDKYLQDKYSDYDKYVLKNIMEETNFDYQKNTLSVINTSYILELDNGHSSAIYDTLTVKEFKKIDKKLLKYLSKSSDCSYLFKDHSDVRTSYPFPQEEITWYNKLTDKRMLSFWFKPLVDYIEE